MSAGYSPAPLVKKLCLKDGMAVMLLNVPPHLIEIAAFPGFVSVERRLVSGPRDRDYVHWFATSHAELVTNHAHVAARLEADGMLWVSWPKKTSKVSTDITEAVLRTLFLPVMLVDVKVCAIDDVWSGLKFMWRREHRANVT